MNVKRCLDFQTELVDVAEGKSNASAEQHAIECDACGQRLAELRQLIEVAARNHFDAPAEMIRRAEGIFVPRKRTVFAALTNFGLAGARAVASDLNHFKLVAEDVNITIMIRREKEKWRVMGRVEGPQPTSGQHSAQVINFSDSQFEFLTESLEEDLWLDYADHQICVPLMNA